MVKAIAFLIFILALVYGFAEVADTPGFVLLHYGEVEYRVSLVTGLVGLLALVIAAMLLWTILRVLLRLPGLISLSNRLRKRANGQSALSRGLIAVGVGDQKQAKRYAGEAQRLLGRDPLALLLAAQSSQLSGDAKGAEMAFRAMLDAPGAQSRDMQAKAVQALGLRGLYIEAERRGDSEAAKLFAEQAYERAPETNWAISALLGFRAAARDWQGAIAILDQSISRRVIERNEGRKQRAILLAAAAEDVAEANPDQALALAQEALRIEPGLVPAATLVGQRLSASNAYAKAAKVLEAAFKLNPHPDLAEAYLRVRLGDSALDRLKRAKALQKISPNAREGAFAIARAALDAREFTDAREALDRLVLEKATMRACLLMAELEESESANQGLVRAWLARASLAPRDPTWVADGVVSERWLPVSPVTGRIGAFEWITPPQASEATLRARIEADRFAYKPPVMEAEALPAPDAAPTHDPAQVTDSAKSIPSEAMNPEDAEREGEKPGQPEAGQPDAKRRFGFFK